MSAGRKPARAGWLLGRFVIAIAGIALSTACRKDNAGGDTQHAGRVGFHIGAIPVSDPEKPPSDEQKPGGVLGYAIHLGTFQEELSKAGFEYQGLIGFPRTAAALLALASGQVEVAVTGDSPAVLSRARGDKQRAIQLTLPSTDTWVVGRKGGPATLAGLSGHKVGTLFGSTFDYYFRAGADQLGIKDIQYAQLPASAALPALNANELDAYLTTAATAETWRVRFGLPVIARLSEVDPRLQGVGITTVREDFLGKNPTFAAAYWRALKTGIDAFRSDPEKYYQWEAEASGVPIDIVRASSPKVFADTPIPKESVDQLERLLDFWLKTNVANGRFAVADWVVNPSPADPSRTELGKN
jgi:sulfonate transport system substrate-binding protein